MNELIEEDLLSKNVKSKTDSTDSKKREKKFNREDDLQMHTGNSF